MDTTIKCRKVGMKEGIMPIKWLCAGWRKEYMQTQNLFGAVHRHNKKETLFWIVKKVNSMKPKIQDRRGDSVERTKKCKNLNCKEVSFNNKRSGPSILKEPRKIKNQSELFAGVRLKHITVVLKKFGSKYCSARFIQWWTVKAYKLSIESDSFETLLNSLSRQRTIVQINKK